MKKIFAFLMTCVMIFTMIPVSVFADEVTPAQEIEIAADSETVEDTTVEVIESEVLTTEAETETEEVTETLSTTDGFVMSTVTAKHDPLTGSLTLSWDEVPGAIKYYVSGIADVYGSAYELDIGWVSETSYVCEAAGLGIGMTHSFSVQAWDINGNTTDYAYAECYVGLNAPMVTAANDPETGHVILSWYPVDNAASYDVMRAPAGTGSYKLLEMTGETSCTDTTGEIGVKYDYIVKAIGSTPHATDPLSAVVTANAKLPTVTGITGSNVASTGKITLTWSPVEGAVGYSVYRSTTENGTYTFMKKVTDSTTYTNTSAEAGVTYFYKIAAVAADTASTSELSAAYSHTCDLARPVITMGNDAETGKITISWDEIDGAVKYQVYRAASKTGTYKLMKTVAGTEYTNSNAVAGTTYYYKVRAVAENTDANSAFSAIKSRLCDLAQPVIKVASSSTSSIKISWAKVTNAAKYQVYRATSKTGTYKLIKTTTSLSYTNSGLTAGKTYYYKVKAIHTNTNANSTFSEILTAKATVMAPTLKKTANVTSSSIKISWDKVTGASGYYVYRRTSTTGTWKKVKTITSGSTTEFNNTGLSAGSYYYSVAAYKTVNGTKYTSTKSTAIRCRTLTKPTLNYSRTRDEDNNGGYQLTWNKRTGATGYQLQCKVDGGSWQTIHTATSGSDTSIWLPTSKYGYTHYFRVRAIYKNNGVTSYGAYSSSVDAGFWYWNPSYSAVNNSKTYSSTSSAVIYVTNKGDYTLRFYSEGGRWIDGQGYTSFNRNVTLYDYDEFYYNERLVKTNYVDIKPGESTYLIVGVKGDPTWYDKYTKIQLKARYNNQYFSTSFSYYYGNKYSWTGYAG